MPCSLLEQLSKGVVLGDGAIGTLLYERGSPLDRCCEELVITEPDLVRQVHQDYCRAGAQVIETNSFGANRWKLSRRGLENRLEEINFQAAKIARESAGTSEVIIAGSMGPLGLTLEDAQAQGIDVQATFKEQAEALLNGGVDFLIFETFTDIEELKIALSAVQQISKILCACSMSFTEDGMTLRGLSIADAFTELKRAGAHIVGANCSVGPRILASLFRSKVPSIPDIYFSAFPNAGRPEFLEGRYFYLTTPAYFAEQGLELVANGVRLIGGCCGTKPEHIAALRKALRETRNRAQTTPFQFSPKNLEVFESAQPAKKTPSVVPGKHSLLQIIKQRTLIVTEFDSPKTLLLDKMLEAARALKNAGTDFLTVADNSLAILRMNCVVASHLVEKETGLRTIVHLACRDRNLIGTQSELMGMDALGLNHVLALTGDPSKVGDTPGATSVYDLNSISLLEGIKAMNAGRSFGGRDLKRSTQFTAGCSFNPNVRNLDLQVKRLERKIAAGAQYSMTQPIFDSHLAKTVFSALDSFKIPILVGVMPLLNSRMTDFLHNEVPGIVIPDPIRERMRGKEGDEGLKEGLAIAREMAAEILKHFQGIYLITPLIRYDATVSLSSAIRSGTI
jgi:methionine synthase / methylenetetrahydrofolate reductase(NADPH)